MYTRRKDQPTLRFNSDPGKPESGSVSLRGFDPTLFAVVEENTRAGDVWKSLFRVSVVQAGPPEGDGLPDVSGRYQVRGDELRFVPHFPFERGVSYRARFDPWPLGGRQPLEALTLDFSLPKEQNAAPVQVSDIFPSGDILPENLLRFYVRFSGPMRRGRVEEQIALLGPDGDPAPDVLYRTPVELWDRGMRHLTVLLDPGRLKRGVGPHVELGPPLRAGQAYTLAVGAGMVDESGQPLRASFHKRFHVTEAVREPVAVERWELVPPPKGSRQPLVLFFPRPLDWAMLFQAITIASAGGLAIDGNIAVDQGETRWSFMPTLPWAAGDYHVRVAPGLEDVCGNNVAAAFDGPLRSGNELTRPVTNHLLAFHLG